MKSLPRSSGDLLADRCADTFDTALVDKLGYRVPALLFDAVRDTGPFDLAVDLGCGTGLKGERLRPIVGRLEGYDISAAMLKRAESKGLYDRLVKAGLQSLELPEASADLIIAADVLMYVGRLEAIVAMAARACRSGGTLAFSVEESTGPDAFRLRDSRRYAHSETYVREVVAEPRLELASLSVEPIRMDRGTAIQGLIVVARRGK